MYDLAQVFLKKSKGQTEVLMVLENFAGARHRESMLIAKLDFKKAIIIFARRLSYRGDIEAVNSARLRVHQRGGLKDDKALLELLINEFESYDD